MSLVFQPAFLLKDSLERHAGAGFRRRGFLGLPRGLLRQFPVRHFSVNRTQVEQKGDCGVAVGNELSAEIRLKFPNAIRGLCGASRLLSRRSAYRFPAVPVPASSVSPIRPLYMALAYG
jgi:hypothetical protein